VYRLRDGEMCLSDRDLFNNDIGQTRANKED